MSRRYTHFVLSDSGNEEIKVFSDIVTPDALYAISTSSLLRLSSSNIVFITATSLASSPTAASISL